MSWAFFQSQSFWALIGVVVGAFLTTGKDFLFDWRAQTRSRTYAAIRLVCVFDVYAEECANVAADEGEYTRDEQGQEVCEISIQNPTLSAFADDIDWKSLDPKLIYRVLNFPIEVAQAERAIRFVYSEIAFSPDYEEGFEERQLRYAELGLAAHDIAEALRRKYALPRVESTEWNPVERLIEVKARIEKAREEARRSHQSMSSVSVAGEE
ncbi:hypothetical protein F2P47_17235 [Parvibaculum sedimenti]|uniref:Uncharacterized protein n=1 Tax=Parvibaculum sedimenti TaxID=2608632 RepID=A0A6N6VGE2_9HYPH|nr:hypothetical protein [Parvibaculum sedimenti]KAB7738427.1 hypothetical protein F2P47_17235 [Parvibaculum sedimenti]